jgi:predicted nucleic acid-binding protein
MIFADASALIAIITGEPEADSLADLLESEQSRRCPALCVRETIAGLCRSTMFSVPAARMHVSRFFEAGAFVAAVSTGLPRPRQSRSIVPPLEYISWLLHATVLLTCSQHVLQMLLTPSRNAFHNTKSVMRHMDGISCFGSSTRVSSRSDEGICRIEAY